MPWVRSYVRSDGTQARGHSRWAPGARREVMIFSVVALAMVGLGNGNVSAGGVGTQGPRGRSPTVQYSIRFDNAPAVLVPKPRPTVSYPIRWQR